MALYITNDLIFEPLKYHPHFAYLSKKLGKASIVFKLPWKKLPELYQITHLVKDQRRWGPLCDSILGVAERRLKVKISRGGEG